MEELAVEVCLGTTCFVMGGAGLQELIEIIPRKYGNKVKVSGASCLDMCFKNDDYSRAPFVKVGDEIISEATVEKVLEVINEKLGK